MIKLSYNEFIKRRISFSYELVAIAGTKDLWAQTERKEQGIVELVKIRAQDTYLKTYFHVESGGAIHVYPSGISDTVGFLRLVYLKPE
jgi:hypothetical protein